MHLVQMRTGIMHSVQMHTVGHAFAPNVAVRHALGPNAVDTPYTRPECKPLPRTRPECAAPHRHSLALAPNANGGVAGSTPVVHPRQQRQGARPAPSTLARNGEGRDAGRKLTSCPSCEDVPPRGCRREACPERLVPQVPGEACSERPVLGVRVRTPRLQLPLACEGQPCAPATGSPRCGGRRCGRSSRCCRSTLRRC